MSWPFCHKLDIHISCHPETPLGQTENVTGVCLLVWIGLLPPQSLTGSRATGESCATQAWPQRLALGWAQDQAGPIGIFLGQSLLPELQEKTPHLPMDLLSC